MSATIAPPFLTDDEIAGICEGVQQAAAQRRYLSKTLRLVVHSKPNGRPLVARSEFERVLGAARTLVTGTDPLAQPNVLGMMEHLSKRKHGQKSQGR